MLPLYLLIISCILSFIITFIFSRYYIKLALKHNIFGFDVHKLNKPKVANIGGFVILLGFIFGSGFLYPFLMPPYNYYLITAILVVTLTCIIGIFDDLFELKPLQKIILLIIASIPLVITRLGDTSITIPFIGKVNLWIFYSLVFVPLFVTIYANATNFLAGYNGLEAGLGIITLFYFILISIITKNYIIVILLVPFISALIAFYYYNKYPSKIFIGDSGTLMIGAIIACAGIIGNCELLTIYLCILYLVNFALFVIYTFIYYPITKRKDTHISTVDKNNILTPLYFDKNKKHIQWHKLYFLFEHIFYPCTEKKMVAIFFTIQFVIDGIVLLFFII